ncbi:MAG: hypothetical protein Tsb0020_32280 [Haliangiales bacterium]
MSTRVELVYEYWDCSYCGAVGVRGDLTSCATCGHPRDESVRFYRPEVDEYVTDEAQAARFQAGPDWLCAYCSALNSALDESCRQCGASAAESQRNYLQMQQQREAKERAAAPAPAAKPGWRFPRWLAVLLVIVAVLVAVAVWAFRTKEAVYVVSDLRWQQTAAVERYQWVEASDWEDQIRGDDVERVRTRREVRRYDQRQVGTRTETYRDTERVQVGTEEKCTTSYKSTGSGASEKITKCKDVPKYENRSVERQRQVPVYEKFPVYGQKVDYRAKRFVPVETVHNRGCDNQPTWPEPKLGAGLDGKADRVRRGDTQYLVELSQRDSGGDGPATVVVSTAGGRFRDHYALDRELVMQVNNLGKLSFQEGSDDVVETGEGALLQATWSGAKVDDACLARRKAR